MLSLAKLIKAVVKVWYKTRPCYRQAWRRQAAGGGEAGE